MRALILNELKTPLELRQRDDRSPGPGQVAVELKAAALNRRDYWITQGMYPGVTTPVILGSDGAGVVCELGEGVSEDSLAKDVIINPGWNWGEDEAVQSDGFQILGMPVDGTFATRVVVPAETVHRMPEHLDARQAAALPLAGVTAYRALLTQGNLQSGESVLISGIGGGGATFALQYAVAVGANVFVTSSSAGKIERAITLGAKAGFDYTTDRWHKAVVREFGPIDLIIDSGGGEGYGNLLDLAAPGGRIVNYGATAGPPKKLDLFKVFWKQLRLSGSTMGSPADFAAMLDFVKTHQIKPVVDEVFPLCDGNAAMDRMKHSRQFGKIVLDCEV